MRPLTILVILASGCVFEPETAIRISPPSVYHNWWYEVGTCLGRAKNFDSIEWYMVPGVETFETPKGLAYGTEQHGRITIAEGSICNSYVVTHEMIHAYGFNHPPRHSWYHRCVIYPGEQKHAWPCVFIG